MRTLCVAEVYPWPADDGYRQRLDQMVVALAEIGEVDFVCAASDIGRDEAPPPPGIRMLRVVPRRRSKSERLIGWLRDRLPRSQLRLDTSEIDDEIRAWTAGRDYDVAYFSHLPSWRAHGHLADCPTVVDFNDLGHLAIRSARRQRPVGATLTAQAKWLALQPIDLVDERRMERVQLECAAAVDAVTLCSQLDVDRSGMTNAHAVPNGCERTSEPPARRDGSSFLLIGAMGYPPNADAARWFVREVFPAVRADRPDARVRIVGGNEHHIADLASVEGVDVLGRVDDIGAELDRATVAVVPIRSGSGTRLKVVEALANRLPLVATHLGVEGIDVVDERHALLADDPDAFALACLRLLDEPALRAAIADEG